MSEKTATERLCEQLEERGEYYKACGNRVWWGRPIDARTGEPINVFHNRAAPMGEDRLMVELQLATPEQVINATLGRGTCHFGYDVDASNMCEGPIYSCDACGALNYNDATSEGKFRYCPNCGRRIEVSE